MGSDDLRTHQRRLSDADCAYSIVEASGSPAGFVILCGLLPPNQSVELKRIVIAEPGRGLGREVLKRIIDLAFTEFSAHRLWLDVYEDNLRARHVYQSLGFIDEGTLRECVKTGDRYRSLIVMSMLESEYRNRAGT